MDYTYATNMQEMKRIDKLNELKRLSTYWDDVRKITKNVKSDTAIKRWQHLAEIRFEEVKQEALLHYCESCRLLSMEIGSSTMDLVLSWVRGTTDLPRCDMSGDSRELALHIKRQYKVLQEFGLIGQ